MPVMTTNKVRVLVHALAICVLMPWALYMGGAHEARAQAPKRVRVKAKKPVQVKPALRTIKGYLPGSIKKTSITFEVIAGKAVIDGDIILGAANKIEQKLRRPILPAHAIKAWKAEAKKGAHGRMSFRTGGDFRWPGGRIPFVVNKKSYDEFADDAELMILTAISRLNAQTNLNIVPRTSQDKNYIKISNSKYCMSPVGMQGGKIIKMSQTVHVGLICGVGATMHEILHAAGFWHTQSRADRDKYVTVKSKNIAFGKHHNFWKHTKWTLFAFGKVVSVPYDVNSIMHYGSCYFAKDKKACGSDLSKATLVTKSGQRIKGSRSALAATDVSGINKIYKTNAGNWQPNLEAAAPLKFVGLWGSWANSFSACPPNTYAFAFRQKVQAPQGDGFCGKRWTGKRECKNDDTALNAIQLKCRKADGSGETIIKSKEGGWGTWGKWRSCKAGRSLNGFRIRFQANQGGKKDDSGANSISFSCSDGSWINPLNGSFKGHTSSMRRCPKGLVLRSFRTRVQSNQGSKRDDSALNGAEFRCITPGAGAPPAYICSEGQRHGATNCKVADIKLKYPCRPGKSGCPYWIDTKYKGVFKRAKRSGKRYVCDEGQRAGKKNCRIATVNFRVKQPKKCRKKQSKTPPGKGCIYWLNSAHRGVFRRVKANPAGDAVGFVYKWFGTAPICRGRKSDCTKRGMEFIKFHKRGDGKKCWDGQKVLCRAAK